MPLLGTQPEAIDLAEDRGRFGALLERLGLKAPAYATAHSEEEALAVAPRVGFPLLVRPSYVLGGRAMEIVYSLDGLEDYLLRVARGAHGARDLPRPLPRERDRGRRRRDLRRRGRLDRRRHAARRGGRDPLRRLGLRAAAALARARDARRDRARRRGGSRSRSACVGLMNVQYARARRRPLRDRGQPARVADGAVRVARRPGIPLAKIACRVMLGEKLADARPARRPARRPRLGQGGGAAVRPLRRLRLAARARDALDRRGDGRGRRLPGRVREGAGGGGRAAAARRHRVPDRDRLRQGRRGRHRGAAARPRLRDRRDARDGGGDRAHGHPGPAAQQDRRGVAARRRLDRARRRRPRHQHPDRHRRAHRRLRDPRARRSPAGSPASRRCPAGWRRRARSRPRGTASPAVVSLQELHARGSRGRCREPARSRRSAGALCPVVAHARYGAYDVISVLDAEGPPPEPGQFYMLAAGERWGGGADERPFLPRAFSVLRRHEDGRLDFLLEDVGPGTRRLCELRAGDGLWLLGPLGHRLRAAGATAAGRCSSAAGSGSRRWRSGRTRSARRRRVLLGFRDAAHAEGAALLRDAARRHRRRLGRPPRARHRTAQRGARRPSRGLRLRAAADARGGARAVRGGATCRPSSRSSRGWRAGSAPASAASCRRATATSGCASTARCSTRADARRLVGSEPSTSAASSSRTRSSTRRARSTRSPPGARSATRCSSASRSPPSSPRPSRSSRARATRRRGCGSSPAGMINSIGLPNKGLEGYLAHDLPRARRSCRCR